jgi:hypothetical protein
MHLYLSYAREHWTHEGENPPVGIILCSAADTALARYTLDTLPNKVMAREYQLALAAVSRKLIVLLNSALKNPEISLAK